MPTKKKKQKNPTDFANVFTGWNENQHVADAIEICLITALEKRENEIKKTMKKDQDDLKIAKYFQIAVWELERIRIQLENRKSQ